MIHSPSAATGIRSPRRLRIGVSARIQYGDPAKPGYLKKNIYYLEQEYAHWILAHGALVFLVPDLAGSTSLTFADYAAELDGLMLQGGSDISPQCYGEEPLRPEWAGDPQRDRYELELLKRFLEAGKPVLGICRGQQLINVALGGTLYQDTLTQVAGTRRHHDVSIYDDHYHDVEILPGTRLAALYPGRGTARVNTIHHQAVRDLGRDLVIEARSLEDGLVEAIRSRGAKYLVGVQWHPEFLHGRDPGLLDGTPLLQEFLQACRENPQSR